MANTTEIRKASERGNADHGWLKSRHSFSFASYYDPEHMGFSDLLVINDDHVAAGGGFDTHAHRDMEIVSYVLQGSLRHKDTLGTGSVIRKGDVQLMSAGKGVAHSEYNASSTSPVHFLQIWLMPNRKGIEPSYQQQYFPPEEKRGNLRLIISPDGYNGSLSINQDVRVYAGLFHGPEGTTLNLPLSRYAYVHVANGAISVNGHRLKAGDGLKIRHTQVLEFNHGEQAEVLVFDLRPHERPGM